MSRAADLADALATLTDRLHRAALAAGRSSDDIELLPVTKFFPASDVVELIRHGCTEFGESREQEASRKITEIAGEMDSSTIRWHMIGRVQRNKARAIGRWAHTVHAVDSTAIVTALDRAAQQALDDGRRPQPLRAYVQVSLDGDPNRGGADVGRPGLVDELCDAVVDAGALEFVGLMAVAPMSSQPDEAFAILAAEHHRVQTRYQRVLGLSAGMSDDLEAAVGHGSTCVRVGTALLGRRPLTSP